jgi:uncharacterized protein YqgV (UPF0045/DUF77 family)
VSETVLVALISAGLPTIASLAAVVQSRRTRSEVNAATTTIDGRPLAERVAVVETEVAGLRRDVDRVVKKLDA